ncbi:MAG: hypothetical protein CL843_11120 [Crocinitomicaceae bacterium]|nr:hypothetical protein [Crocinitomicaceae bacterium]|tara:strand:- start:3241 stop:4797 length:1557 start_codon:yes stop_codon:yes gene_type:complete
MKKSLFLVGALFSALTLWMPSYGQSISYTLEPSKSMGYLSWEESYSDGITPTSWGIRYYSDAEGNDFLFEELLNSNYFRFSTEDLTSSENYFQIVSYDANEDEIGESDIQPVCPSCFNNLLIEYYCNGTTYAYKLQLLESGTTGEEFLAISEASQYISTDPVTGLELYEPYKEYMRWDVWQTMQASPSSIPYEYQTRTATIINNTSSGTTYRNAQGSTITYPYIAAINKKKRPYGGNPGATSHVTSFQLTPNNTVTQAVNKFNYYADYSSPSSHDILECISDPNGWFPPYVDDMVPDTLESTPMNDFMESVGDVTSDDWFLSTMDINDRIDLISRYDPDYDDIYVNAGAEYDFDNDNIASISFISVNNYDEDVILLSEDLYDDGVINYPSNQLNEGLYEMHIAFIDGTIRTMFFDKVEGLNANEEIPMADAVSVTVYPTPVDGDYNLNVTSSNMTGETFSFSLMDLNGYELYSSVMTINSESELYSISYSTDPTTDLVAHKLTFSDGSTKIIKTYAVK